MIPKNLVKVQQKPASKAFKTINPQEKVTRDKNTPESRSPANSISNKNFDAMTLIRNASKKKENIEKMLEEEQKKQHELNKKNKKEVSINSNSSKTHSSIHSQISLERHKRLQFHKQRTRSIIKDNPVNSKSLLSTSKLSIAAGSKQPIPKHSKNTKSGTTSVQNKDEKAQKKNEKIIQSSKPIENYLNSNEPCKKSKSVTEKVSIMVKEEKIEQNLFENRSKQVINALKRNQTESKLTKKTKKIEQSKLNTHESNSSSLSNQSRTFSNEKNSAAQPDWPSKLIDVESISSRSGRQSSKKSSKKSISLPQNFEVPIYSDSQLQKIDRQIKRIHQNLNEEAIKSYYSSVICLMSWIWQAHMPNYKNLKKQNKIDSSKCLRGLLEIFAKNKSTSKIFEGQIFLNKVKFQTDLYFQKENPALNSKIQRMEIQESDSEEKFPNPKNFFIYDILRVWKTEKIEETRTHLIFLLLEVIIYNYDEIVSLDQMTAFNILKEFRAIYSKSKKLHSIEQLEQNILQELIVYAFSELNDLKINVIRSPQFLKKKKNQGLLWKFFFDIMKISHNKIKSKQFINFQVSQAFVLQTSYNLALQFTHYAKKYPIKNIENINIIEFESFIEKMIERIIEFDVYVSQLKDRQKNQINIEIDGPNRLFEFQFDLPIYDWAILAIKSDERKTFENIVKHCKKLFIKNLQKKSISKYEVYKNKPYVKDRYARFTIQELPEEDKSYYEEPYMNGKVEEEVSGYKISHDKVKAFVSIPHMNFLTFKELVPESVKRLAGQKRRKASVQRLESHLLYLLILSNSHFLLKLIVEIEFTNIEMLSPEIAKGLIRLCNYCHDFKGLITSEKYLKILNLNSIHRELTQKIFEKESDYLKRLSTSLLIKNATQKFREAEKSMKQEKQNKSSQKLETINILQIRVKSCQTMYFELIMEIQNATPYIKLDHYIQELLKNPSIFRHDKFYVKLLQIHHPSTARQYLYELIVRYIDEELRMFDMMAYFEIFGEYCLKSDSFDEMIILIRSLPIGKLVKFHSLLFSETFSDQILYRLQIPDGISREERFSILTSAGFEEKTKFIDQNCNTIPELILWRKYMRSILSFDKLEKYISIKSFFTIIHDVFSDPKNSSKNHEYIDSVIQKLKTWIEKDKIDQVASAFHFLSLALFPHKKSKMGSSLQKNFSRDKRSFFGSKTIQNKTGIEQKFTLEILYLIGSKSDAIIQMYKNKQSLTMRCLGQEMRKRQVLDFDEKVDDMKRREVLRMLNKIKNVHDYMIRCIIRFVENVNFTNGMLRNFNDPEKYLEDIKKICRCEHMEKDQKIHQANKEYHTPNLNFKLSSVCSNNVFEQNFKKQLKRYDENPMHLHDRYSFMVMIRSLADCWIEEKIPSIRQVIDVQNESKGHSSKLYDKNQSKTKDKVSHSAISSMISIEKIFDICIQSLNNPINVEAGVRQCEKLKQKLITLETLYLLFRTFTNKHQILKFMAPSTARAYKTKYHSQISSIIIKLLMNNTKMLGKEERDLSIVIRLKTLSIFMQNYSSSNKYSQYQWKIVQSREYFWFLINTLGFDKNLEIRFFIMKSLYSRNQNLHVFKNSIIEKLTLAVLMTAQQNNKSFVQVMRRILSDSLLGYLDSPHISSIFNTVALHFFSYLINLNTIHFLQKGENKLDYRNFFMFFIDIIFDKKEFEAYLYGVISYFQKILHNLKGKVDPSQIFNQVKWIYDLNVEFYMMARAEKFRLSTKLNEANQNSNTKVYLELLQDMKDEISSKQKSLRTNDNKNLWQAEKRPESFEIVHPKSKQIFTANVQQALYIMEDVFLERFSKSNKKSSKTKKPQTIFKNLGTIFSERIKQKSSSLGKASDSLLEKKKVDEIEFDI